MAHFVVATAPGGELSFVLRCYPPGDGQGALCRREAVGLGGLRSSDLPVPTLLISDPEGELFGTPATALGVLGGELPETPGSDAWRQLGEFAARLHSYPAPAGMATFRPQDPGAVEGLLGAFARSAWERVVAEAPCFLHGDLCIANALFATGRLSGVVDWTRTIAGPPSFDLASLWVDASLFGPAGAAAEVVAGYHDAGGQEAPGLAPFTALLILRCRGRLRIWVDALRAARMEINADVVVHRHRLLERDLADRLAQGLDMWTTEGKTVSERPQNSNAPVELDCEAAAKLALAEGSSSRVYTRLVVDPGGEIETGANLGAWSSLPDLPDEEVEGFIRANTDSFLEPGGSANGSETPVRRAAAIGRRNGLLVVSGTREGGSSDSDHHPSQEGSAAVDLSNYPSPSPEMERTAAQIALALGASEWVPGEPLVREVAGIRAQLLWRVEGHESHVHFGCRRAG